MIFRKKALESTRLTEADLEIDDAALLSNLMLTEGKYLKRAVVLLFHQTPEIWIPTHGSNQRNPMIAGGFFRSGMIESWGRGIGKIIESCYEEGKPAPIFDTTGADMMVTLFDNSDNKAITEFTVANEKFIVPNGIINGTINLDENNILLLKAVSNNPEITYDGLATFLGMSRRTVSREMKKLQEGGLIEREGSRKNGRWIVRERK